MYRIKKHEKIHFCLLSHPVWGILLQQSLQTNPLMLQNFLQLLTESFFFFFFHWTLQFCFSETKKGWIHFKLCVLKKIGGGMDDLVFIGEAQIVQW